MSPLLVLCGLAFFLTASVVASAGSRTAQEKLAWMFTLAVKCPGARVNFQALERFIVRERINFTDDSPEMLAIRKIGFRQQAGLKGVSKTKICAMARTKFGPTGTDIRGLYR